LVLVLVLVKSNIPCEKITALNFQGIVLTILANDNNNTLNHIENNNNNNNDDT